MGQITPELEEVWGGVETADKRSYRAGFATRSVA